MGPFASHVREINNALEYDLDEVFQRSVCPDPPSLPTAQPAEVIYPVRDLSDEWSSETMVPADIGPSHANSTDAPDPAAESRYRHPAVPRVTRSSSQAAHHSAAICADRPPAQALASSSVDHGTSFTSRRFLERAQGARIEVYGPQEPLCYPSFVQRLDEDVNSYLKYDEGEHGCLNLADEQWHYCLSGSLAYPRVSSDTTLVLPIMLSKFANNPFMRHKAQLYLHFVMCNAYDDEEADFKRTVTTVPLDEVPDNVNIIASYTL